MTSPSTPVVIATADQQVYRFPDEGAATAFEATVKEAGGELTRLAPAAPELPQIAKTLYDLEQHLAALLDTEATVSTELEQEYKTELCQTLTAVVEKRDRVGQFRNHLRSQIALAHEERQRLADREALYQSALDRLDLYITYTIESLGKEESGKRKDKWKRLEGKTLTLGLHGCKQSVEVTDEEAVPARFKRVNVTLPAETWEAMVDSLDLEMRAQVLDLVRRPEVFVDRTLAYGELSAGAEIPGLTLGGGFYVEVK